MTSSTGFGNRKGCSHCGTAANAMIGPIDHTARRPCTGHSLGARQPLGPRCDLPAHASGIVRIFRSENQLDKHTNHCATYRSYLLWTSRTPDHPLGAHGRDALPRWHFGPIERACRSAPIAVSSALTAPDPLRLGPDRHSPSGVNSASSSAGEVGRGIPHASRV